MMLKRHFMHFGGDILQNSEDYNIIKYTKNSTFYYFELFNFCKMRFYRNHKIYCIKCTKSNTFYDFELCNFPNVFP
jgi:hypothetical protein